MVKMVVEEVEIQIENIKSFCNQYSSALESVSLATTEIILSFGLTGEGMNAIKSYISTVYPALCRAAILHSEATITANQQYLEGYTSLFGSKSLDSDELETQIREVSDLISDSYHTRDNIQRTKDSLPDVIEMGVGLVYQRLIQMVQLSIDRNQEKKAKLEEELQKFLDFSNNSTSYFDGLSHTESLLNSGMQALGQNADGSIGSGSWNGTGFALTNTSWIKDVNTAWAQKNPDVYGGEPYYGGNQSSAYDKFDKGDPIIGEILKKYFPDMTKDEMLDFLLKAENEGCGYIALVNSFLSNYTGTEEDFEKEFGFPLYTTKNGQKDYNYDYLFVDLYAATDNHHPFLWWDTVDSSEDPSKTEGRGTSQGDREHRYALYLKGHNMDVDFKNNLSPTIANYDKYHSEGELILSVNPILFENDAGELIYDSSGGHAVSITGKTEDGRLIVSSWGKVYYVNPDSYKNAENFSMQVVIHK